MSEPVDQLVSDLKANLANLKTDLGPLASAGDVAKHLKDSMWPMIEAIVEQIAELDGGLEDVIHESEDILHEDTAAVISAPLATALALAGELGKRLQPGWTETDVTRKEAAKGILILRQQVTAAGEMIEAITLPEADDDEEEPETEEPETGGTP